MTDGWICKDEQMPNAADADERGRILVWHRYQHGMLYAWDGVHSNRYITHWMPISRLCGTWIDIRKRRPTAEDADAIGCVLARHVIDGITVIGWHQLHSSAFYTHFARLPDAPKP